MNIKHTGYIFFLGLGILTVSIYSTYSVASRTAFKKGQLEGLAAGKTQGARDFQVTIETALKGASVLFVDKYKLTEIPYQSIIHSLDTSSVLVSSQLKELTDSTNKVILSRIIKIGGFSTKEEFNIINNYQKIKGALSKEVIKNYNERIDQYSRKRLERLTILKKTEAFSESISSGLCDLMEILSLNERYKLAEKILQIGNERNVKEFGKAKMIITSEAINYASNLICFLILENSFEFVLQLFLEYAQILDFTEEYLIKEQNIKEVMKLVTAEVTTSSFRTKTFERKLAIDPNYSIQTKCNVIAGINLEKLYRVEFFRRDFSESGKTQIIVTLPEPEILSIYVEIFPNHENLIFAKKLRDYEVKELFEEEKEIGKNQAIKIGILNEAKQNAKNAFIMIYSPLILNSSDHYEIIVKFDNNLFSGDQKITLN